jgi:hypothetical protein
MYNTEELYKTATEAITKNKLIFIEDIVAYLPCAKPTFYEHFPTESDGYKKMVAELDKNRIELKVSMRSKWYKSNAPALQLGLYKLLSSEPELRKLSMQVVDQQTEMKVVWHEEKTYEANDKAE